MRRRRGRARLAPPPLVESAAGARPVRALGEAEAAPKGGGERGQGWRGRRWGHARAGEGTEGGERRPSRRGAGAPWHGEARPSTYHLARQAKLDSRLPGGGGEDGSGGRGRVVLECVCLVLLRRSPVPTIPSPGSRDPGPLPTARCARCAAARRSRVPGSRSRDPNFSSRAVYARGTSAVDPAVWGGSSVHFHVG